MTDVTFVSEPTVELVCHMGSDAMIAAAARVSTGTDLREWDPVADKGLINFLMREKHGTPFEHSSMTFRVTAPIFVWREHMRHRIGISYNEESGRYRELQPVFYVPEHARVQEGRPGAYKYALGTEEQGRTARQLIRLNAMTSYASYQQMLRNGIAREMARMVLPVNIMSSAYVTFNPRSLMNFLELRLAPNAQAEIQQVASRYLQFFGDFFPNTANAFEEHGNVAP